LSGDFRLTNGVISIGVNNMGAELTNLRSEGTGLEYLWQADPKFWGKHAPVLFPIVGALRDNTYTFQGNTYHMNQHGLARTMRFDDVAKSDHAISFRLRATEETLKHYPFNFELFIDYELIDDKVIVRYRVHNLDSALMLFSIGGHPGFRCPLQHGERYEDYSIIIEPPQTLNRYLLDDGLIAPHTEPLLDGEAEIKLTRDMFDRGALVFKDVDFKSVQILNQATGHGVTMEASGFPYFGIWAPPGADFVCLEPWHGIADNAVTNQRFEDKEGIRTLAGKSEFSTEFSIKVM